MAFPLLSWLLPTCFQDQLSVYGFGIMHQQLAVSGFVMMHQQLAVSGFVMVIFLSHHFTLTISVERVVQYHFPL